MMNPTRPPESPSLQTRFSKGDRVTVDVVDAAEAEKCFGRLQDGAGVFIRGLAAVGDRVEASVSKIKPRYLEARLIRVVDPSPDRVQPICPHFGTCGGCRWQHVKYDEQLRLKRKQVEDALIHVGGFAAPHVRPVTAAPRPYGYRNKLDFTFGNRRFLLKEEIDRPPETWTKPGDFAVGFHAPFQYAKVIDIDYCFLGTPEMNRVLEMVRSFALEERLPVYDTKSHQGFLRNLVVRQSETQGAVMVNLVTQAFDPDCMNRLGRRLEDGLGRRLAAFVNNVTERKNLVAFGDVEHLVCGSDALIEQVAGLQFAISANSFFQTNTAQAENLYQTVLGQAGLEPADIVYDLYCGTGAISLVLAGHCARVLGIDVIESAISDATGNASRNGIGHCTFRTLDLKDLRKSMREWQRWGSPNVVVSDPPRAGMHPKAVQALRELSPRRIVYVSCKPTSLARDAQLLCEGGSYRLDVVQPVDMFPQTNHIECVARFDRG